MQLKKNSCFERRSIIFFFFVRSVREVVKKKVQYNNIKKSGREINILCARIAGIEPSQYPGFQIRYIENIHKKIQAIW